MCVHALGIILSSLYESYIEVTGCKMSCIELLFLAPFVYIGGPTTQFV